MSKVRNSAIELYRVLLMFLIVVHHAAYHGHWNHARGWDADCPILYILFTALTIWHVDGFISITGWFGTRFTCVRFARLWGIIAFYTIPSVFWGWFVCGRNTGLMAGGWFGCTYLYFLFLTPILNPAIEWLARCDKKRLYVSWALLVTAIVLTGLPHYFQCFVNVRPSGVEDFSIMTFILVYVNARLLKVSGLCELITQKHIFVAAALFCVGVVLSMFGIIHSGYGSPQVMLMAIAGLVFFAKYVRVPDRLARVVTAVSPLTFGIYIIHETTSFGRLIYQVPQRWLAEMFGDGYQVSIVLCTAIFCFSLCAGVDALRRVVVSPIVRKIMPMLAKIDKAFDLD